MTTGTSPGSRAAPRMRLYTPGPVEVQARILRALAQVPPHHRTEGFRATLRGVVDGLRWLHGTEGEMFLLAASGTGAMEAAVVNLMSPGEKALAISGGKFGERWQKLLEAYGLTPTVLSVDWGSAVSPAEVERALDAPGLPRFYFDLRKARKSAPLGETAFTPPVSLVLALEESLAMIREEGLEAVHLRHARCAQATRAGAQALGFRVFASAPSHAVTALTPPEGIESSAVVKRLREVHGMVVAGGQDRLQGKILRIGHMGAYDLGDITAGLVAPAAG